MDAWYVDVLLIEPDSGVILEGRGLAGEYTHVVPLPSAQVWQTQYHCLCACESTVHNYVRFTQNAMLYNRQCSHELTHQPSPTNRYLCELWRDSVTQDIPGEGDLWQQTCVGAHPLERLLKPGKNLLPLCGKKTRLLPLSQPPPVFLRKLSEDILRSGIFPAASPRAHTALLYSML